MTELTPQERDALICDCANSLTEECPAHGDDDSLWIDAPASEIIARVERIVAARVTAALAPVEYVADEWEDSGIERAYVANVLNDIRDALAAGREQATP